MNDLYWMQKAYALAMDARDEGEIPVGAVLVDEQQTLIGFGSNQVIKTCDPSAHAEILALRQASFLLKNPRLTSTTLYVTLEPCCMCAGALVHARVQRVVFATRDVKAGAAGSVYQVLKGFPLNHTVRVDEGIMQHECAGLLTDFFRERREQVG